MSKTIKKESVKFVPFQKSKFEWLAQINIEGQCAGWLNWIEATNGAICTVGGNATTPMGQSIATDQEGAKHVCAYLQQEFEADRIGWVNCNLKKGGNE